MQMEKFAKQALTEGIKHAEEVGGPFKGNGQKNILPISYRFS